MTKPFYSSGNEEIDHIRRERQTKPTDRSNFVLRAYMLKQWVCTLQQQGMFLDAYRPKEQGLNKYSYQSPLQAGIAKQEFTDAQVAEKSRAIDEAYEVLDATLARLREKGPDRFPIKKLPPAPPADVLNHEVPWAMYQGNSNHTGYTPAPGPTKGEIAWKAPIGLGWYCRPVVENGKIYVSSPGMRTILYCLDAQTGHTLWETKQLYEIMEDQLYSSACNWSTPVVLKDQVVLRQMGSRGPDGDATHALFVDKASGALVKQIVVGHIDYKVAFAPILAGEDHIYYLYSEQNLEGTPSRCEPFNRLICKHSGTGATEWDLVIGPMFADPIRDDGQIFVGSQNGSVFCVENPGSRPGASTVVVMSKNRSPEVPWVFHAGGEVNSSCAVDAQRVFFGANDGGIYALDRRSGELLWRYQEPSPQVRAFKHFTTPLVHGEHVILGGATGKVYCLDKRSGALVWQVAVNDWVRSRPLACDGRLYVATVEGSLYVLDAATGQTLQPPVKVSAHPIYADLVANGEAILVQDSDLRLHCVDAAGQTLWMRSNIASFVDHDGRRILTNQLASGAFYQCKASAANGRVYIGTHSRFLYCFDNDTGKELWKFEVGGAIATCPILYQGRVYLGHQGGSDDFFCLDALTGLPIWKQNVGWVWGSANISNDLLFVSSVDGFVNCLEPESGAIRWRYRSGRMACTEPVNDGGVVYFGGWDGYLYAFAERTGKPVWQFYLNGGSDSGAQIALDGKLYMPMIGGYFRCFDARTRAIHWEYAAPEGGLNASAALYDHKVYLSTSIGYGLGGQASKTRIVCVDATTGKTIWTHEDGGGLTCAAVARDKVYFGATSSPYFYCVDAQGNGDGTTTCHFQVTLENKIEEICPCLYRGKAFVLSSGGYFYAIA